MRCDNCYWKDNCDSEGGDFGCATYTPLDDSDINDTYIENQKYKYRKEFFKMIEEEDLESNF